MTIFPKIIIVAIAACLKMSAICTADISRAHVGVWFNRSSVLNLRDSSVDNLSHFDYDVMTTVISKRFGTILLGCAPPLKEWPSKRLWDWEYSFLWLPTTVAQKNQKRAKNGEDILKVMVSFSDAKYSASGTDGLSSLEVAKRMADEANAVFPGTVTTLVFISKSLSLEEMQFLRGSWAFDREVNITPKVVNVGTELSSLLTPQLARRWAVGSHQMGGGAIYKLGAVVDGHLYFEDNPKDLNILLSLVDMIIPLVKDPSLSFVTDLFMNDLDSSVDLLDELENCESKLRNVSTVTPPPEVVPLIVPGDGKLVQRWELVSDWAVENNRSVIMFEAFDEYENPRRKTDESVRHTHFGWWGIAPHWEPGQLISSMTFVEKAAGSWRHWKRNKNSSEDELQQCENDAFKFDRISVAFDLDPRVVLNKTVVSKEELREMVVLIASKFGSVVVYPLETFSQSRLLPEMVKYFDNNSKSSHETIQHSRLLPEIVAEFNRNLSTASSGPKQFLEVKLAFSMNTTKNSISSFRQAKELADKANTIHPGTVTTLVFFSAEDYKAFAKQQLENATAVHLGDEFRAQYKLASFLNATDCAENLSVPTLQSPTGEFLPYVDTVFLVLRLIPRDYHRLWGELRHEVVNHFMTCSRILKGLKQNVKVLPALIHPSIDGTTVRETWMWMNEWAAEHNGTAIMFSAFDEPFLPMGWWRLKNASHASSGGSVITKDSFEEKAPKNSLEEIAKCYDGERDLPPRSEPGRGEGISTEVTLTLSAVIVICIVLTAVVALNVMKRYGRHNFHQCGDSDGESIVLFKTEHVAEQRNGALVVNTTGV